MCNRAKELAVCNTSRGAKASASIYSVIETAKENGLRPYDYLKYLFEQLPQLTGPLDPQTIEPFMPWSSSLPITCRVLQS
ncbi:transposase domain-containing protein [Paenibacillus germinis]|uniref:transposase domain-containing protein n=1 Tax=Paenibacillus germinis TaxID=2654979 RepID=UPI0035E3FCD5